MAPYRSVIKSGLIHQEVREDAPLPVYKAHRIPRARIEVRRTTEEEGENEQPAGRMGLVRRREAARLAVPFDPPSFTSEPPSRPMPEEETPAPDPSDEPEAVPPVNLEAMKAEWEAEWEARMAKAVAEAREEGREAGRTEAEREFREELESNRAAFREEAARLREQWRVFLEKAEPMLAHLAFTTAQTILDAPLPEEITELATRALSRAVDQLAASPPLRISLHPVDLLRLRESGLIDELTAEHSGIEWDSDEQLREGDWIVQSPSAMIRHIKSELLHSLRARLDLPALDD